MSVVSYTKAKIDALLGGKQDAGDYATNTALTAGLAGRLAAAASLSDLPNAATARTNLGLGSAAIQPATAFDASGAAAAAQAAAVQRANHTGTQAASTVTGLSTVATSGAYTDLSGKPTIPAAYTDAQAQAANSTALATKANIADIGTAGTATGDALKAAYVPLVVGLKADGATDDTAVLQAAVNALPAAGGTLQLPAGSIRLTASLTIPATGRVSLRGAGQGLTTIVGDSTTDGYSSGVIACRGSIGAAVALTADALIYATTISVTSTSGIAVGDWLLIGSTAPHASNTDTAAGNSSQPRGEQVQVAAVTDATTLSLVAPLRDNYTVAATGFIQRVTFAAGVDLRDLTVSHGSNAKAANITSQVIYAQYARDVELHNVTMRDGIGAGIHLDTCRHARIVDCSVIDLPGGSTASQSAGGTSRFGYGVDLKAATEDVLVHGLRATRVRHAVTVDGIAGRSGVVRRVLVAHGIATQCKGTAWDTHANGDDIVFDTCTVSGTDYGFEASTPNGFLIRSRNTRIINPTVERVSVGIELWHDAHRAQVIGGSIRRLIAIGPNAIKGAGISIRGSNDAANLLAAAERVLVKGVTIDGADNQLINVAGNAHGLEIIDNRLGNGNLANTASSVATSAAIAFLSGLTITNFLIRGNDIGNDPAYSAAAIADPSATGNMQRAFYFGGTSTLTGCMIADNTYDGLLGVASNVRPFSGTAQGGIVWRGNRKPSRSKGISNITVTASPFTYQAGDSPEMVHIYGGTVTSVLKATDGSGGSFSQVNNGSPASLFLEAKEAVQVVYSVAPTMRYDWL